jgi:hypothetical protein
MPPLQKMKLPELDFRLARKKVTGRNLPVIMP